MSEPKREVLPVPDQRYQGLITYDAKDPSSQFLRFRRCGRRRERRTSSSFCSTMLASVRRARSAAPVRRQRQSGWQRTV